MIEITSEIDKINGPMIGRSFPESAQDVQHRVGICQLLW